MAAADAPALPILLVSEGPEPPGVVERFGEFDSLIATALASSSVAAAARFDLSCMVRVYAGDPLPPNPADKFGAVLLSGSKYNVTETHHEWLEPLKRWVREHSGTLPIFGICFGHQLLTVAFEGAVAPMETGKWGGGAVECAIDRSAAAQDEVFGAFAQQNPTLWVNVANGQAVSKPGPGAVVLGASPFDPHIFVRHAPLTYSVQFHPEYPPGVIEELHKVEPSLPALPDSARDTNAARELLAAFISFAVKRFSSR